MRIETIAIGDELLTGKISDTNSTFVADQLFQRCLRLESISVIPDTIAALHDKMNEVGERADIVICFGGLGPTSDDKTAEAVASLIGSKLVTHEPSKKKMLEFYASRGRRVLDTALKQVLYPEKCTSLPNAKGMAPGFSLTHKKARFYFLPGVPMEMKTMFQAEVLPKLGGEELLSHQWKCLGIWESELQDKMNAVEAALPSHAYLGYRTRFPENHLTLYWRENGDELFFQEWVRKIRKILEPYTYTEEAKELEELIVGKLKEKKLKIAFAESCTAGLAVHRLSQIPGASDVVWGGAVTYQVEAKRKVLGLDVRTPEEAVAARVAKEMAESVRKLSGSDLGAGITGFMGPDGGTSENPPGTVYLCVTGKRTIEKRHLLAVRERQQTQWGASTYLLAEVLGALKE